MGFIPTDEHLQAPSDWIKDPGKYTLKIADIENVISSNGNPGYKLKLNCIESGAKMTETLYETEKAFWRICLFAKACSVQIERGQELVIDGSFIGKTFEADVAMSLPNDRGNSFAEIAEFGAGKFDSLFKEATAPAKTETAPVTKQKW